MVGGTCHILTSPAENVDGLGDVAVHAADEHVVLFGAGGGDEGQEGGEEETHCVVLCCVVGLVVWCGVVLMFFCGGAVCNVNVMLDRGSKGGGLSMIEFN